MVLYCASDLLWATRIKATAEDLGIPCRPVRNLDMLRARLDDSPVRSIILDLEAPEACAAILAEMRGEDGRSGRDPGHQIAIVAFAPHVKVDLLESARRGGADRVLTRGAFDSRLPELLRELA